MVVGVAAAVVVMVAAPQPNRGLLRDGRLVHWFVSTFSNWVKDRMERYPLDPPATTISFLETAVAAHATRPPPSITDGMVSHSSSETLSFVNRDRAFNTEGGNEEGKDDKDDDNDDNDDMGGGGGEVTMCVRG